VHDPKVCWLPTVSPESASGKLAAWYVKGYKMGNLFRAMTLSPQDTITFYSAQGPMCADGNDLFDFVNSPLALEKIHVEVIAARISSFNGCRYCTIGHSGVLRVSARSNPQVIDVDAV
jgi:AhpD family alkylhydroperoxidase|tara:strand:- start:57 stop:410 length:354 start_codon:yes stop_codon:yes gene_type:complete